MLLAARSTRYSAGVVNTFLPYPSFVRSAHVLDRARLGRQRTEVVMILRALHGESRGYVNHPAAVMWRGYEAALVDYGIAVCNEWESRGHHDTQRTHICDYFPMRNRYETIGPRELKHLGLLPWWFGWRHFHRSHRSNLYRKDPMWYEDFAEDGPDLPYVWPKPDERVWGEKHAGAHRRTWQWYYQPH